MFDAFDLDGCSVQQGFDPLADDFAKINRRRQVWSDRHGALEVDRCEAPWCRGRLEIRGRVRCAEKAWSEARGLDSRAYLDPWWIKEEEVRFRARACRVEPTKIVGRQRIAQRVAADDGCVPLAALRLVAGDGVSELDPQRIEEWVIHQRLAKRLWVLPERGIPLAKVNVECLVLVRAELRSVLVEKVFKDVRGNIDRRSIDQTQSEICLPERKLYADLFYGPGFLVLSTKRDPANLAII